jgi:hypothetical protein
MAIFTRTNGDAQPVFALDVQNGPVSSTNISTGSGNTVQPAGPKLDFWQFAVAGANAAGGMGVNGAVSNVLQSIQQLTTVAIYQVDTVAGSGNTRGFLSVALYDTGTFGNAAQALAAANVTGEVVGTPTNVGFKLAAS